MVRSLFQFAALSFSSFFLSSFSVFFLPSFLLFFFFTAAWKQILGAMPDPWFFFFTSLFLSSLLLTSTSYIMTSFCSSDKPVILSLQLFTSVSSSSSLLLSPFFYDILLLPQSNFHTIFFFGFDFSFISLIFIEGNESSSCPGHLYPLTVCVCRCLHMSCDCWCQLRRRHD